MNKDQALIIGLFVAATAGFIVGYLARGEKPVQSLFPTNYDPARPIVMDALRASQEQTERCYKDMVALLGKQQPREGDIELPPSGLSH